jgi:non-ribosomal peptide synthase protein (TIGR01720 family)
VDARDRPPDLEGDERVLRVTLTADETRALLQDVPRAYGSQINDALLAGLVPVLAEWHGGAADPSGAVWIDLEGHGREDVVEGVDVSRTVSCFTTVFPVALRAGGAAPGDRLRSVKEQLRAVPHRGLGYGLLRYLRGDEVAADLAGLPPSAVMFNYLGRLDPLGTESLLALVPETVGPEHSPKAPRTHRLLVNASVADGRLRVDWHHNPALDPTATIATLADRFLDELRSIVAHCATGARGYTPSDFSLIRIDQHRLDALVPPGDTVEDIYPLTPIQEGMLLHYRLDPDSPAYRVQWSGDLAGPLDAHALERAWAAVVARHPALRARFAWDGLDEPLQVVERVAHLPFTHHDWRALSPEDREHRLAQITSDRHWDVDPRRAPLMAITLARLDDELHHFAWRFHHLPIDGWTMALLLREALEIYQALRNGRTPELPPPVPYRVFLEWLGRRDEAAAEEFWRSELADFAEPTPLPGDRGAGSDERPAYESRRATLDLGETTALLTLARDRQLTLGTLLHGAWALALAHNSGRDDVVFGNIVTGRPPELPGVESIVGLLLNSVPVRIRVPRSGDWARWLAALQARQAESRPFEWAPPVLVQAWSEVPRSRPLYETNVSLQAYAGKGIHDEWRDRLGLRNHRFRDWNPYALSLAAELDPKLVLLAKYDSERVASSAVDEMLDALVGALRALCQDPGGSLADLRGAVNLAVERGRLDRRTASRAERSKTLQGIRRRPAGT